MSLDDLILSYRDYYGNYHHHKEQMAYGATVLYLGASTWVTAQSKEIWGWGLSNYFVVALLMLSAVAGFLFVIWQLRNRELAADIVLACTTIAARLLSNPASPESPESKISSKYKGISFPKLLTDELDQIASKRCCLGGARVSEAITYLVMAIWTLGAGVSLYCTA